jgi:hypothetical protein
MAGVFRFLLRIVTTPTRVLAVALWLLLAWIFQEAAGHIITEVIAERLRIFTGYTLSDVEKTVSDYLFPLALTAVVVTIIFLLGRHERTAGGQRKIASLNEAFRRTQMLFDHVTPTEEIEAWKVAVKDHTLWLQRELSGKIPQAEINVLVSSSGGPRLNFRGGKPWQEMNYLHYLEKRIEDLIGKYS